MSYPCLTERPNKRGDFHLTRVSNIRTADEQFLAEHGAEMVMWPHWLSGFMVRLTVNYHGEEIVVTERVTHHSTCEELIGSATELLRGEIRRADHRGQA